ncbi:hypothetical protein [Streptomyces sp. YS-3]|uniref:hypothetical protein n=1 Tax=Streptomyces sp. YS-3 TaxID=3381352 RepID=UPI003862277C
MVRGRKGVWIAGAPLVLAAVLSACGGDDEDDSLTASRVCDGLFSQHAAADALRKLTGASLFADTSADGLPETAKFLESEHRKGVNWSRSSSTLCVVAGEEKRGSFRVQYDIYAPSDVGDTRHPEGAQLYRLGKRASARAGESDLYFECVSPESGGAGARPVRVHGRVDARGNRTTPNTQEFREASLSVLHAASLKVVKEMGCENSGGLSDPLVLEPVA